MLLLSIMNRFTVKSRCFITFTILLILFCETGMAQTIVTDRPDQTESALCVPKGSLQVESGLLFEFFDSDLESINSSLLPTTLLRFGLFNAVELRLVAEVVRIKQHSDRSDLWGMTDMEIGAKIHLFQFDKADTDIALLTHVSLSSGTAFNSDDENRITPKVLVSHALNNNISVSYNLGYSKAGDAEGDLLYTLAVGKGIGSKSGVFIETYGEVVEMDTHLSYFNAGFTYLLSDNTQLDMSFGTGINHDYNFFSFGGSFLFSK